MSDTTGPGPPRAGPPYPSEGRGHGQGQGVAPGSMPTRGPEGRAGDRGAGEVPLPRRPQRRPPRAFPILLGLVLILGFGFFAFIMFLGSILGLGGFGLPSGLRGMSLGSRPMALLKIEGAIMSGPMFDFWMDTLQTVSEDDEIEGLILRIDSPGGSVVASQELYDEIIRLRKEADKTVYVSMGDLAASGGYYIAVAADRIFANRGTLTGSVGVISTFYNLEGLSEKTGVQVKVVKTGRFKDTPSMFREMGEEDIKLFDALLDDTYEQFVEDILVQREAPLAEALAEFPESDWELFMFEKPQIPSPREFLLQIADGRVYTGEQAKKLGLVDELGSLNYVISRMSEDLGIDGEPRLYEPRRQVGLFDLISGRVRNAVSGGVRAPTLQYRFVAF